MHSDSSRQICVRHLVSYFSSLLQHQMSVAPSQMSDLDTAKAVMKTNKINCLQAKIPVKSNWNLELFASLCTSTSDREVLTFLTYGWPLNREPGPVAQTFSNHASANCYPGQIQNYLQKEIAHGTMMGPFVTSPFPHHVTGVSPMSTRPKKEGTKRRVIVDLRWPLDGPSVNSLIPKDKFLGTPAKMIFPTINMLCQRAFQLGPGKMGWRKDMERAFHQVPLDLLVFPGGVMGGTLFFDKAGVMGCRSAPYACQRTTNAIRHFMLNLEYIVYNYIDDFMSIDEIQKAWQSY